MSIKNIGLALSGGGFRAAVYHLGILARLAEDNLLEEVTAISTVSGGSLGTGLVYTLNGLDWPTSTQYADIVVPKARERLTTQDLQSDLIARFLYAVVTVQWGTLLTRATALSQLLHKRWGVKARLSDLRDHPRWYINATCYESGKDWRFEKRCAGDYRFGYTHKTDKIRLSDALAASSGFPGLVGALPFELKNYVPWNDRCFEDAAHPDEPLRVFEDRLSAKDFATVHLWDGGVYDNQGLEVFHDFDRPRWQGGVEFLIVSDASGPSAGAQYTIGAGALLRIISGVMMPQIRGLRSRAVVALMRQADTQAPGAYLLIGNTCEKVLNEAGVSSETVAKLRADCLVPDEVKQAKGLKTEIRRLTPDEFRNVFRHGFEVADYTLLAYHPAEFEHIGYRQSRWPKIVM